MALRLSSKCSRIFCSHSRTGTNKTWCKRKEPFTLDISTLSSTIMVQALSEGKQELHTRLVCAENKFVGWGPPKSPHIYKDSKMFIRIAYGYCSWFIQTHTHAMAEVGIAAAGSSSIWSSKFQWLQALLRNCMKLRFCLFLLCTMYRIRPMVRNITDQDCRNRVF